jgi:hypothetical protein
LFTNGNGSGHLLFFETAVDLNVKNKAFKGFKGKRNNRILQPKPCFNTSKDFVQKFIAEKDASKNTAIVTNPKKCYWEPLSAIKDKDLKVIIGNPNKMPNYFRVFSHNIPKLPKNSVNDADRKKMNLLPHRFRNTARVYGISPLALVVKSTPKRLGNKMKLKKENRIVSANRLGGPELAPAMAEFNEFPDLFLFESKEGCDISSLVEIKPSSYDITTTEGYKSPNHTAQKYNEKTEPEIHLLQSINYFEPNVETKNVEVEETEKHLAEEDLKITAKQVAEKNDKVEIHAFEQNHINTLTKQENEIQECLDESKTIDGIQMRANPHIIDTDFLGSIEPCHQDSE